MYGMLLLVHIEIQRHRPGHEINVREAQDEITLPF